MKSNPIRNMIHLKEAAAILIFLVTVHAHPGGYGIYGGSAGLASAGANSGALTSSRPYGQSGLGQFGARYTSNVEVRDNEPYYQETTDDLGKSHRLKTNQNHGEKQNDCSKCDDGQYKGDKYYEEKEEEDYEDEGEDCDDGDDGQYHMNQHRDKPKGHRHRTDNISPNLASPHPPTGVEKIYGPLATLGNEGSSSYDGQQVGADSNSPEILQQSEPGHWNSNSNNQRTVPSWQKSKPESWNINSGKQATSPTWQPGNWNPSGNSQQTGPTWQQDKHESWKPSPAEQQSTVAWNPSKPEDWGPNTDSQQKSPTWRENKPASWNSSPYDQESTPWQENKPEHWNFSPDDQQSTPRQENKPGRWNSNPQVEQSTPWQQNHHGNWNPGTSNKQNNKPEAWNQGIEGENEGNPSDCESVRCQQSGPPNPLYGSAGSRAQPGGNFVPSPGNPFLPQGAPKQPPGYPDGYPGPLRHTPYSPRAPTGDGGSPRSQPGRNDNYNPQSQSVHFPFENSPDFPKQPSQFGNDNPRPELTKPPFGGASPAANPGHYDAYNKPFSSTQHPFEDDKHVQPPGSYNVPPSFGTVNRPGKHSNRHDDNIPQSQATLPPFSSDTPRNPGHHGDYDPITNTPSPFESSPNYPRKPNRYDGYNPQATSPSPFPSSPNSPQQQPGQYNRQQTTPSSFVNSPISHKYPQENHGYNLKPSAKPPPPFLGPTNFPSRPTYHGGYSTVSQTSTPNTFGGSTLAIAPSTPSTSTEPSWQNSYNTPSWNQGLGPNKQNNLGRVPSNPETSPPDLSKDLEPPKKPSYSQSNQTDRPQDKNSPGGGQCSPDKQGLCNGKGKEKDDSPLIYIQVQPASPGPLGSRKPLAEKNYGPKIESKGVNNRPQGLPGLTPSYDGSSDLQNTPSSPSGSTPSWSTDAEGSNSNRPNYSNTHGRPLNQGHTSTISPWDGVVTRKDSDSPVKPDGYGASGSTVAWTERERERESNIHESGNAGGTPSWVKGISKPCGNGRCPNSFGGNNPSGTGTQPSWNPKRNNGPSCVSNYCPSTETPSDSPKPENHGSEVSPHFDPSENSHLQGDQTPAHGITYGNMPNNQTPHSYPGSNYGSNPGNQKPGYHETNPGSFLTNYNSFPAIVQAKNDPPEIQSNQGSKSECKSKSLSEKSDLPCSACGGLNSDKCGGGPAAAAGPVKISSSVGGEGKDLSVIPLDARTSNNVGRNNPFLDGPYGKSQSPNGPTDGDPSAPIINDNDKEDLPATPSGSWTERPIGKGNPFLDRFYTRPTGGYGPFNNPTPEFSGTSRPIGRGNPFLEGLKPNNDRTNYGSVNKEAGNENDRDLQVIPQGVGYDSSRNPSIPGSSQGYSGANTPVHGTSCVETTCIGKQSNDADAYDHPSAGNGHNGEGSSVSPALKISADTALNPYRGIGQISNPISKQASSASWTIGNSGSSASAAASASAYAYSGWSGK
ncbi:collagen alpha-1(V) chain-like isoform X2 [Prorops nasuta]|uniref:collagen alpha-1(V) chain-like isoform X2 n=1 Tax=Prorops nasuta TaxID=863751 RepID=UPI0034CD7CDE